MFWEWLNFCCCSFCSFSLHTRLFLCENVENLKKSSWILVRIFFGDNLLRFFLSHDQMDECFYKQMKTRGNEIYLDTYCSRSAHSRSQSGHWNSMRPSSSLSRSGSASVEIFRSLLLFCKSLAEPKSSSAVPLCCEPENK